MIGQPRRNFWQRIPARRMPPASERRTHIAIADRLRDDCRPGWWWSHIPSGEYRTEKTGALLQRMGLRAGMADFLLIDVVGAHYWLELKRGASSLSEQQAEFLGMLRRRGVKCAVARSYADAVEVLETWGAL
jgi:VRR-NUC domain